MQHNMITSCGTIKVIVTRIYSNAILRIELKIERWEIVSANTETKMYRVLHYA